MDEQGKKLNLQPGLEVQETEENETEINLIELLLRLVEKWKIILAAALVGALLTGGFTVLFITPTYKATAKLYVMNSDSLVDLSAFQIGNYLAADYQEIFSNHEVQETVKQQLGLDYTNEQLSKKIEIRNPNGTRILYITAQSEDPVEAMNLANTFATVAQTFVQDRMDGRMPPLFETAIVPEKPFAPSKAQNTVIGFVLGALIACVVIVILFITDDRIRTSDDIEKHLNMPTLGMMPLNKGNAPHGKGAGQEKKTGKRGQKRA